MAQIDTLTNVGAVVSTDLALILRGGANVLGTLGSLVGQNSTAVSITGGTINGTTIGATTPATVAATTLSTTGAATFGGAATATGLTATNLGLTLQTASVTKSALSVAATPNQGINGTAIGDVYHWTTGGKILWSTDNGTTAHMTLSAAGAISTTGAATFGGATTALSNRATGAPIAIDSTLSQVTSWVSGTIPLMTISNSANTAGSRNFDLRTVSDTLQFHKATDTYSSSTQLMTLDAAGALTTTGAATFGGNVQVNGSINTNLQSLSAWTANTRAIELTTYGAVSSNDNTGTAALSVNAYESSESGWSRVAGTAAARFQTNYLGEHKWSNAIAGIAGSAISWVDQMTLDTSGNLLVGKTSVGLSSAGFEAVAAGTVSIARADTTLQLNRLSTDGEIAAFYKDTVKVGSIGTFEGVLTIGTGDTGLLFGGSGGDYITPRNPTTQAGRDAAIDLGTGSDRFKDLYLSGDAIVGGVGTVNDSMWFLNNLNATGNSYINFYGYQKGVTQFRNLYIANGKGSVILELLGDTKAATFYGSLSKASGSFKIDHPLPEKTATHHLVHSFVESPQANNIYRGKVDLIDGLATVNVDDAAGMTEGTYVLLNTNTQCFTSNESGWTAVKGSVSGNILTITAQESCSDTISWMVIGERHDQHMLDTEWTDENGKVIVEPLKQTETLEEN